MAFALQEINIISVKISKLLNNSTVLKFLTRQWIEINDLLNEQYSVNK